MLPLIAIAFLVGAVLGHVLLWLDLLNRSHAMSVPQWLLDVLRVPHVAILAVFPLWGAWHAVSAAGTLASWQGLVPGGRWMSAYALVCCCLGLAGALRWVARRRARTASVVVSNHTTVLDIAAQLDRKPIGSPVTALFDLVPWHQMFELHVHEKTLALAELPQALDGLSILHVSDLHFSGRITRPYFEAVIEQANALRCDLVAVTGDIVDEEFCLDWLPPTVGRLRAPGGVYYVLGNHDKRLRDTARLRRELNRLGLMDLGGRQLVASLCGESILLAGNERPWFASRLDVPPPAGGGPRFRVLLSHSPDQIGWARRHGFHLMLAGHTHGGQICLPLIGAVVAPSHYGVRYAAGVYEEPPTVMHVSRGVSGLDPIRIRCAPEITRLVLRLRPAGPGRSSPGGGDPEKRFPRLVAAQLAPQTGLRE